MEKSFEEADVLEKNGKKYALLPLCIFHDIPIESRDFTVINQFGLIDTYESKSLYEITDEKKFMLAKIKYNV